MAHLVLSLRVEFNDITSELLELGAEGAKRMIFLARQWGCVPETLLQIMNEDNSKIEAWYRKNALTAILKYREAIPAIAQNALSNDTPSEIFFCRPWSDKHGHIYRQLSCPMVPTATIHHLLAEALQNVGDDIKQDFFNILHQFSEDSLTKYKWSLTI